MTDFINVLREYQQYGLLALIVTVFCTPLAIRIAHRFGVLDIPDQKLKPHAKPIPYLGGTAICVAWALVLLVAMLSGGYDWHRLLPLLLGGIAMSVLGLVDDVRHVRPKIRLLVGAVVITAVILCTRVGFHSVGAVFHIFGLDLPDIVTVPISVVIGVFIVLGACNSANLIDGLDGLCTGVTAIISLGFFMLASHLAAFGYSETGDPVRLVMAIAMVGAALGFLPWNFNPAKIFMGDAGSVLLGYNCGMLILLFAEGGTLRWVIGALMIFALPIFDTALAMFRRWRAGRSIFEGDRSHFYDQLVQRGVPVRVTVLISYGLTLVYAGIGLLLTWVHAGRPVIRLRYGVLLYIGVTIATGLLAWKAGLTNPEEPRAKQETSPGGD